MNASRASLQWWAFTTSAKNLLSSPFGIEVLELIGLQYVAKDCNGSRIGVAGATRTQARTVCRSNEDSVARHTGWRSQGALQGHGMAVLRLAWQALCVCVKWAIHERSTRIRDQFNTAILTYADSNFRADRDSYFGNFARELSASNASISVVHLAYVQISSRMFASSISKADKNIYASLFSELHLVDIACAFFQSLAASNRVDRYRPLPRLNGADFSDMIHAALLEDIAKRGYFKHVLVHRAIRRLVKRRPGLQVIYPYENKSLEKMLLLAIREFSSGSRTVGYQHTSVTNRHTTLLFARGEADRSPLPDRIVTAGAITMNWLEENGNYPPGLIAAGVALRQAFPKIQSGRFPAEGSRTRLLFALSSSYFELERVATWIIEIHRASPEWKLAIRTHPEFPASLLPVAVQRELSACAANMSATPLAENLEWSDIVAYSSSTVALEALLIGRPVVHLDLDEFLDTDPTLGAAPNRWLAVSPAGLISVVKNILAQSDEEFLRLQRSARSYAESYLHPTSQSRLGAFFS